jgi:hypothetical protein
MMPVSLLFYTNIPNYHKNWLWRGNDTWHERWHRILEIEPEFVEMLTWNDYGESHYIGPIRAAGIPAGAKWYVQNNPHDAWRIQLPY